MKQKAGGKAERGVVSGDEGRTWSFAPHRRGSDRWGDHNHPGHTIWPLGVCVSGLSRGEARRMERAINAFRGVPAAEMKAMSCPGFVKGLVEKNRQLTEALEAARSSLKDLSNGWPARELHEPIGETLARADRVLG